MFNMFILLLVLLPPPTVALNCQMACDHCYDDSEDPPLREVYCSMCDECLAAKRANEHKQKTVKMEKPQSTEKTEKPQRTENTEKTEKREKPDQSDLRMQEYGWDDGEQMDGMYQYPECPTAPPCSDEEEEVLKEEVVKEEVTETNCPQPYMPPCMPLCPPRPTCPPIIPCKPKKQQQKVTRKPMKPRPRRPMKPWCWPYPYLPQTTPGQQEDKTRDTTNKDFVYVYVGVPKGVISRNDPT